MEIQIQELIEQIKAEGVNSAEAEAKAIIDAARIESEKIIAEAKEQADRILANSKIETERMTKSSEEAIRQAGRNLLISFRESVTKELTAIAGENINKVYSSEALAGLIVTAVEHWNEKPEAEDITVILNSQDLENLEENLMAALKEKMVKGITLRANDNFDGGFRIAVNNGSVYYDYSKEAVVEMLSNYLNPKVTELLKEAE